MITLSSIDRKKSNTNRKRSRLPPRISRQPAALRW
jgi:hypothetical protein